MQDETEHGQGPDTEEEFQLDGRWHVLPRENRIVGPGVDRRVPDKFMRVLVHLRRRPGVVSRRELMDAVWPDTVVVEEVLTRAVSELRKVFGDDPRSPRVIETIPKRGYRLLVEAAPLESSAGAGRRWLARLGLAAAVVVAIGYWAIVQLTAEPPTAPMRIRQFTSLPGVEEYPCLTPTADRLLFAWEGDDDTPTGVFVLAIGEERPLALSPPFGHYAYPAWTHDLRHAAYSRVAGGDIGLFTVPATGGEERRLVGPRHGRPPIMPDFAPDGRRMVFAAPTGPQRGWRLEALDLETGELTILTDPDPDGPVDRRPRYAPDGGRIAFLRRDEDGEKVALRDDAGRIRTLSLGERTPWDLDWTRDGGLVVTADDGLWAVDPASGRRRLISADRDLGLLSIADAADILAYSEARADLGIWELPLAPDAPRSARPLIDSSAFDGRPALSPDGRHIAFVSSRGDADGLWIADRDGGDARAIVRSATLYADAPAWSPDGRDLAFTLARGGHSAVAIVAIDGGPVRVITPDGLHEARPSWSRDGASVYVSRTSGGLSDIWKRPADGVEAVRMTRGGGWRGCETPDGAHLLYARSDRDTTGLRRVPAAGGPSETVFPLDGGEMVGWTVAPGGVYICRHRDNEDRDYRVEFRPFDGGVARETARLESRRNPDLAYDPLRHALLYTRTERLECDIVGIENF